LKSLQKITVNVGAILYGCPSYGVEVFFVGWVERNPPFDYIIWMLREVGKRDKMIEEQFLNKY